jgi:hypothetical protein
MARTEVAPISASELNRITGGLFGFHRQDPEEEATELYEQYKAGDPTAVGKMDKLYNGYMGSLVRHPF